MGLLRYGQQSYPSPTVAGLVSCQVGSNNKPSYSKESLATVAMLMTNIIITCTATVTKWLAVSKGSLLSLDIHVYRLLFYHFHSCLLLWVSEAFLDRIVTSTMNYLPRLMICLNNIIIMISALHHFLSR